MFAYTARRATQEAHARVAHNSSRTKQADIARSRHAAELERYLVPGWQIDRAKPEIVPVATVLGAFERGQEVLLRCGQQDCRRRVVIDLKAAVHAGLGDRPLASLSELLRCRHWNGCQLREVSAAYPQGVPIIAYLTHPDALIAITCASCARRFLLPPAAMIDKLRQAGRGDGATGVLELGKLVRGPCRECRQRKFISTVIWAKAPGTG